MVVAVSRSKRGGRRSTLRKLLLLRLSFRRPGSGTLVQLFPNLSG